MRKYFRDRMEALAPQGAEDLTATFITMAQAAAEHVSGLAAGLMERSAEARAALVREVKDLIAAQIEEMGLATKKEMATLRARVDRLEAKGAGARVERPQAKGVGARLERPQAKVAGARKKGPSAKKPSGGARTARRTRTPGAAGKGAASSAPTGSTRSTPRRPSSAH